MAATSGGEMPASSGRQLCSASLQLASPGAEKQEFRTVHIQLPPNMLKEAGQGTLQVGICPHFEICFQEECSTASPHSVIKF
jgi:hypothetical protein